MTTTPVKADLPPLPQPQREPERRAELARMKRSATGLLLVVAIAWLALELLTDSQTWAGYLIAATEAGMVGGLADWFAVTALFRHPLNLPIPHTAVVAARKEQFGVTLGDFVQQNFLSADVVGLRINEADIAGRLGRWLVVPANAAKAAGHLAELGLRLAEMADDDDVTELIEDEVRRRIEDIDAAPVLGRLLRVVTAGNHHHELLDQLIGILDKFLTDNRMLLRDRFTEEAPWWLPEPVDEAIFNRLFDGVRALLRDAATPGGHGLREQIHVAIEQLVVQLEYDPAMSLRINDLKAEALDSPALRQWIDAMWTDIKGRAREQATRGDSALRARLTAMIVAGGKRLLTDANASTGLNHMVERGARATVLQFRDEIAGLISSTVARWDAEETSDRLELLLGPDLQFIRINGTVVGAAAGVLIHLVGQLLA